MVVSEGAINNIMGGMENTAGVRLHSHRHKLKQRFDIIRKLGQGTYGKVQLAVNKETGQEVAIKTIKKAKIETEQDLIRIRREIQIMSSVQHPQIIHIYEVFENREKMVLVMEYAAGGELYDYLSERKVLPEEEARRVFRHVASATYYCHKHKICHRDLKLENILLDLEGNAKIADFGLSNVFDDGHRLDTFCGSPLYASPEIVKGIPYTGPEVDCWSLGVLLYTLVYGAMPFDGSNFKRLVKQITQGDYYEPKKPSRASDLIRSMLTVSATKRASVEDIAAHWWVNEGYTESCLDIAETLANQTPVRLDLLLSLAPKHINSEHMLIQPDDEDSSMRSPPTSECGRAPPELQLPPPPPPPSDSTQPPVARTSSLSGIYSVNTSDLDALFAQRKKEKKEAEKKRKIDDVNSLEKKKKKDVAEGTPRPIRKESCPNKETVSSGPKPPSVPVEANSSEKKKIVKKVEENETSDKSEKSDRRKSIKRRDSTVENDTSDKNEQPDRRRSLVKRRESTVEREISDNDKKKIVVKKRESSAGRPSKEDTADRRRSIRAKETPTREIRPNDIPPRELKPVASSAVESVSEPSSVINLDKSDTEDQTAASTMKPPLPKDQGYKLKPPSNEGKSSRSSSNKSLNGLDSDGAASMEVVEIVESLVVNTSPEGAQNSASMRSVGSSNEMTLKASDSSLSRESASPMKLDGPIKGKESPKPSSSQTNLVKKTRSKSLIKNSSKSTINEVPSVNGELTKPAAPSEVGKENIPQETTDIKHDKESKIPTSVKIQDSSSKVEESAKESSKSVSESNVINGVQSSLGDSISSKGSSESSSLLSSPMSSRTESESPNDPRPTSRPDAQKRQSKIFQTAALWDNMVVNSKGRPPPIEKPKKSVRTSGINMSDITKQFENNSKSNSSKNKITASFKVSDAKKAFEKPTIEKPFLGPRKKSVTDTSSTVPKPQANLSTTQIVKDRKEKSPSKEKVLKKELEKEKSPRKDLEKENSPKKEKEASKSPRRSCTPLRECEKAKMKEVETNRIKEEKVINKEEDKSEEIIPNIKGTKEVGGGVSSSMSNAEENLQVARAGVDDRLVKPKTPTCTVEVSPRDTTVTSSHNEEPVVVGGLELKLGGIGKIAEVGTKQDLVTADDSSDSSESESEAEKILKIVSEKREKIEAAKREKLRKNSEAKEKINIVKQDMPSIKEEIQSKTPSNSPSKSPEKSSEQKFATLPRGFKTKSTKTAAKAASIPNGQEDLEKVRTDKNINEEIEGMMSAIKAVDRAITQDTSTKPQRKAKIDIVLNKTEEPKSLNRRSSHAEIKLSSPPPKESPRTKEFKTEIRHSVSSPRSNEGHRMPGETQVRSGDAHLQRAKRERIIPIMLEDTDDEDNTTSEPLPHRAGSAERKSRRERIIPIQVEGCGVVTPSSGPHVDEAAELGSARAHQAFQRSMGARAHSLSRGGNFLLDHSESFSSAGEEDEDEEDDAFQILTAESLFSTLLNRVRSLTRKMNDDPRVTTGSVRSSQQPTPEPMMGPGHVGSGPSGSSGFWSSLYSSPRDSPSRRENMSHSSIGREDETLGGMGSPMWTRSVSRDTSDADTFFSEASAPFGTLPRVRGLRHSMHLPHPRLHQPGSLFLYDNLS